jgi:hypothetical protein
MGSIVTTMEETDLFMLSLLKICSICSMHLVLTIAFVEADRHNTCTSQRIQRNCEGLENLNALSPHNCARDGGEHGRAQLRDDKDDRERVPLEPARDYLLRDLYARREEESEKEANNVNGDGRRKCRLDQA